MAWGPRIMRTLRARPTGREGGSGGTEGRAGLSHPHGLHDAWSLVVVVVVGDGNGGGLPCTNITQVGGAAWAGRSETCRVGISKKIFIIINFLLNLEFRL